MKWWKLFSKKIKQVNEKEENENLETNGKIKLFKNDIWNIALLFSIIAIISIGIMNQLKDNLKEKEILNSVERIRQINSNSSLTDIEFLKKAMKGNLNDEKSGSLYQKIAFESYYKSKIASLNNFVNEILKEKLSLYNQKEFTQEEEEIFLVILKSVGEFGNEETAIILRNFFVEKLEIKLIDESEIKLKEFSSLGEDALINEFRSYLESENIEINSLAGNKKKIQKLYNEFLKNRLQSIHDKNPPKVTNIDKAIIICYLHFFEISDVISKTNAFLQKRLFKEDGIYHYRLQDVEFVISYLSAVCGGYLDYIYPMLGGRDEISKYIALNVMGQVKNKKSIPYLEEVAKEDRGTIQLTTTDKSTNRKTKETIYINKIAKMNLDKVNTESNEINDTITNFEEEVKNKLSEIQKFYSDKFLNVFLNVILISSIVFFSLIPVVTGYFPMNSIQVSKNIINLGFFFATISIILLKESIGKEASKILITRIDETLTIGIPAYLILTIGYLVFAHYKSKSEFEKINNAGKEVV